MKDIFDYFRHRKKQEEEVPELFPCFDVKGCIPMAFGVMFRCRTLQEVTLDVGQQLCVQNADRKVYVRCLNFKKDGTVRTQRTTFQKDDRICITVECTQDLMYFPLKGTVIYARTE